LVILFVGGGAILASCRRRRQNVPVWPRFCAACGEALPAGARFCTKCGTSVTV